MGKEKKMRKTIYTKKKSNLFFVIESIRESWMTHIVIVVA